MSEKEQARTGRIVMDIGIGLILIEMIVFIIQSKCIPNLLKWCTAKIQEKKSTNTNIIEEVNNPDRDNGDWTPPESYMQPFHIESQPEYSSSYTLYLK